ncbi:MAG: metallophosphoesterase [Rhodospirillales bacterium]|nr:metallophosphoesterase [Rhodospirillales bacterium]
MKKNKSGVQAFFFSDWHLFHPYSRVKKQDILLTCACAHGPPEDIHMVGDIVDFEFLLHRLDKMLEKGVCTRQQADNFQDFLSLLPRKKHETDFNPHTHSRILDRILTLARGGTRVTWVLGNHDEKLDSLVGHKINDIAIAHEAIFETRHGGKNPSVNRYAIKHGHTFDPSYLRRNTHWYQRGSDLLDWVIERDMGMQKLLPSWDFQFASFGKKAFKNIVGDFRKAAIADARANNMDGIICGHIHVSDYRLHQGTGIVYMNCGDGFTHGTALAYRRDGHWSLMDAKDIRTQFNYVSTLSPDSPVHTDTNRFMDFLWKQALDRHYGLGKEAQPCLTLVA